MIVVTGATGQLGSRIVRELLRTIEPDRIAVSVRDPSKAGDLAAEGVRVRRGDFDDPASLADSTAVSPILPRRRRSARTSRSVSAAGVISTVGRSGAGPSYGAAMTRSSGQPSSAV